MPYAPTVNDNSGQILAGYQTRSAEIKAAGNEALMKGIVDGSLSAIGGITGGVMQNYNKSMETAAKKDGNMGVGSALADIFKNYGTQEQYNNFMAGWEKNSSNPDREAGYLNGNMKIGDALLSMSRQNAQYDSALNLARQKHALGLGGGGGSANAYPDIYLDY